MFGSWFNPKETPCRVALPAAPLLVALTPWAHAAVTDINGLDLALRSIQFQYPGSTLTVNGQPEGSAPQTIALNTSVPGEVRVDGEFLRIADGPLGDFDFGAGVPGMINAHRGWFSDDGGASRYDFDFLEGFDISVDVRIESTLPNQRAEIGYFIENGTNNDAQFLAKTFSNAPGVSPSVGEIAAFGGPIPKAGSLIPEQGPEGLEWPGEEYDLDDTATLRMQYIPPVGFDVGNGTVEAPAKMQYWYNDIAAYDEPLDFPFEDTGLKFLPPTINIALKVQLQGTQFNNDPGNATFVFSNLRITTVATEILGDYNDNGLVEQGDLNQVLNNWGTDFASVSASWVNQRPTEGIVDQAELNVVLNRWGSDAAPDFSGSAVPEPAAVGLVALLLGAGGRRRAGRRG